jgi:hypothetical protein
LSLKELNDLTKLKDSWLEEVNKPGFQLGWVTGDLSLVFQMKGGITCCPPSCANSPTLELKNSKSMQNLVQAPTSELASPS